ncbi:MAG: prolipoprotein diacylglyceryl transferase [Candidatus Pacebacteria bacterium]|nr:prolipoprotein diacylglyceryl transferase [Candidatus Paceibacterota bacterium]
MSFNIYGLLIGIAVVVALLLIEKKGKEIGFEFKNYLFDLFVIFSLTIIFARLWHVVTDFYLYQDSLIEAFYIWNGGMSILGAILGYFVAVIVLSKIEKYEVLKLLDLIVFGLPFAQSIGRWGNYFNQELYGWETNLPWGIMINGVKHHPLFLYESLLTFLFGIYIWFFRKKSEIGRGKIFLVYLSFYSFIRFLLDFLRVEKTMISSWLGLNQLILLFVFLITLSFLLNREEKA